MRKLAAWGLLLLLCGALACPPARAWGEEGHRIVGLVALRFLDPAVRARAEALLAADPDTLTAPDFASRTMWADRWRDSDRATTRQRYRATQAWHFVNMEIDAPDLEAACYGHKPLPPGTLASNGPAEACIVDKIEQFAAELADPAMPEAERIVALKFLLHFLGDLHQPLHAADNHDRGGNTVHVLHPGRRTAERLHAYWDTTVVRRLGLDADRVADSLVAEFAARRAAWSAGTPRQWAVETSEAGRRIARNLPPATGMDERGTPAIILDAAYERAAEAMAREQLAKAGFRLAALLNATLR